MTIGCNIWMICLKLKWLFYDPSWMLQLSEFVWSLRSSVWAVFNNFLLKDATDRSKISSDQKRLFFAVSLYPLSFYANNPFKESDWLGFTYHTCNIRQKIRSSKMTRGDHSGGLLARFDFTKNETKILL